MRHGPANGPGIAGWALGDVRSSGGDPESHGECASFYQKLTRPEKRNSRLEFPVEAVMYPKLPPVTLALGLLS
jgi:hypothetical protein